MIRRCCLLLAIAASTSGCGSDAAASDGAAGAGGSGAGGAGGSGAGCSAGSGSTDEVCVEQRELAGWLHCSRPFPAPPFVHLPPDTDTTAYVAFDLPASVFRKRDGSTLPLDTTRFTAQLTEEGSATRMVPRAHSVYRAAISSGEVVTIEPFVYIEQIAILEASYAGKTLEGLISRRTGPGAFESAPSLPIRMTVGSPVLREEFHSSAHSALTLDNATVGKLGADGTCLPALSAHGSEDPFSELDPAAFDLWISAGMHGQFDDHLVAGLAMGEGGLPTPAFMIALAPTLTPFVGDFPVGAPGSAPALSFQRVTSGGGDCTP